jgi:diguanylate cyclase (GGDEF)-like protein/PAS domain S-box-containing protein
MTQPSDALRQVKEEKNFFFENAVEGIYQSTPAGKFLTVNPSMARIFGYASPHDLITKITDMDRQYYVSPSRWAEFKRLIESQGAVRNFEFQAFRKDGTTIWVSTNARAVRDSNGGLLFYEGLLMEMTKHKLAEESLRKADEKYRLLFQHANDAIFIAQDGVIKYPNRKTEDLLACSAAELAQIPFVNHIHPDDRAMVLERHKKRLTGEMLPTPYSFRIMNKSGEELWIEINSVLMEWEGKPATLNIVRNIGERRKSREEIEETRKKYRDLLENIDDIIFSLDNQGCFTYVNRAVEGKLSYNAEEMIGKPLTSFVHHHDLPDFWEKMKHTVFQEQKPFEFRLMDKKGQVCHMRLSGRPLTRDGQPIGLTGILSEITEEKLSDLLITRAERNYRSIFENALEGIFQSTIDGHFLVANPACARILGYSSPEELITRHLTSERPYYVNPEAREIFQNLLKENGVVKGFEYQVFRKDGRKIWISENALAIRDSHGNVLFYEGTIEDIDERKKAEEKIRFLSFHDKLTELYNRAYFEEQLKRLDTPRQLPMSILLGDVNGLKLINDAFGHREGDQLLIKIGSILRECCRREDVVARIGGDEFAILLPKTSHRVINQITERIKLTCRKNSGGPMEISMALGTACKEHPSQDIEMVFKEAEDRMYRNKLLESKSVRASMISALRRTLFEKSYETQEHTSRLQLLATQVASVLKLPDSILDELGLLATLHDIGKIAIPEKIIIKPSELSLEEWDLIKKHPEIGYRIANSSPEMVPVAEAILSHHEWWNGAGYPRRLRGNQIPLVSRIISVVDAYDVMIHGRPYKKAVSKQDALQEIQKYAGFQFDPMISEIFIKIVSGVRVQKSNPRREKALIL